MLNARKLAPVLLALVLGTLPLATSGEAKEAKSGASIYAALLKKYPSFFGPDVRGLATSTPHVALYIPFKEWRKLSFAEKQNLRGYLPTLVAKVRQSPDSYVGISPNAPVYNAFRAKIPSMSNDAWEIVGGNVKPSRYGGVTITVDEVIACGDGNCD